MKGILKDLLKRISNIYIVVGSRRSTLVLYTASDRQLFQSGIGVETLFCFWLRTSANVIQISSEQTQRFAMEHTQVLEEPTQGFSFCRRPQAGAAMVEQCLEPYRSEATEGGHGVGSGEYN